MATAKPKNKSIVILCDGTSNEIKTDRTNVLRLFRCASKDDTEIVFYDPGVGTVGAYKTWSRVWQKIKEVYGLAFGSGLDDNVLDAYQFLIENWNKGDKIYLFGFSRGAYTVRVLAGLVYTIGIVPKEQENLKRYALHTLKQASIYGEFSNLGMYQETLDRQPIPIEFLGVWDTVSSVFLWAKGWFRIKNIGYSRRNASVKSIRHALAIDERRRFFKHYDWKLYEPHTTYLPHTPEYIKGTKQGKFKDQDVQEVWFAGVHTNVGGGASDDKSQVAKAPLEWMLAEAKKADLKYDSAKLKAMLAKIPDDPDHTSNLSNSLTFWWWIIEFFPKWRKMYIDENEALLTKIWSWLDVYIPLGELRDMTNGGAKPEDKILVHESVKTRMENTDYKPSNLPLIDQIKWVKTLKL